MEENTPQNVESTLEILESGSYLANNFIPTREVIEKITEFSNYLNSTGRIALLNADTQEGPDLIHLFYNLKNTIKSAISEFGKSHTKIIENFVCPECDEIISIAPGVNIWKVFQDHEHFESTFHDFLLGNLRVLPIESESSDETDAGPNLNNSNSNNDHTDSGIEQCEEQNENDLQIRDEPPLGDNSFRFNFRVKYDDVVHKVIYPDSFNSLNKYDQCPYYTIQKSSSFRAVCLLCCCNLLAAKRIQKKHCLDHVLGQRHMKATASQIENLKNYHEAFLILDTCYQAHQVYFEPLNAFSVVCRLCTRTNRPVLNKSIIEHIHSSPHKAAVLQMFTYDNSEFYLTEVQVGCYGIQVDKPAESPKQDPKEEEKIGETKKTKKEKKHNNPSTSKDEPEVEHIIIPSTNVLENTDYHSNSILDFLPHRFHAHAKYFNNRGSAFICDLCKVSVSKDPKLLKKHILTQNHLQQADVTLQKYTYFCEICSRACPDEFLWERHFIDAQKRHMSLIKTRAKKLKEYECTTCKTVIYGDDVSLLRHKNKNTRRERTREPKLPEEVKNIFKSREILERFAELLSEDANNTITCMKRTLDCCNSLQNTLKAGLEDCKTYPFGSRVSGLGNEESDLDLFIDIGGMYFGGKNQDPISQCHIVKHVASILRKQKGEFERVFEVPTARTPIVKLKHIPTQLDCDLSFKHGLSVENTKFLRLCLDLQQPIAQQFILVLKKWSEFNKLTEHITTYALAILAIFYLQVNGYLLSVKQLRGLNPTSAPVIDGWATINYTMPLPSMKNHVLPYQDRLDKLLKDFFAYYSNFNYAKDVVCPLLGHTIERQSFLDPKSLPPEMNTYVRQLKGPESEEFRFRSPFCIQDPFDLSHNLTKACQNNTLAMFKKLCLLSSQELDSH